jgi:hypothetical protein
MASLQGATLNVRVPLDNTTLHATIDVRLTREFYLRTWLGCQLIRLAAWVLGCNVEFDPVLRRVE